MSPLVSQIGVDGERAPSCCLFFEQKYPCGLAFLLQEKSPHPELPICFAFGLTLGKELQVSATVDEIILALLRVSGLLVIFDSNIFLISGSPGLCGR